MRKMILLVATFMVVVGCSSSDADTSAPACTIAGTYDNTATVDATSEVGCTNLPATAKNTITVTKNADATYAVGITGVANNCTATATEACKLQTKCDLVLANPTTAATTGTYQAVFTFTSSGLSGPVTVSTPPSTPFPSGCSYRGTASATRL